MGIKASDISNIQKQMQNKLNIFDEKENRTSNLQIKRRHRRMNRSSLMGSTSMNITVQFPELSSSKGGNQSVSHSRRNSVTYEQSRIENFSSDPVNEIIEILKKDVTDRKKHEVDILVNYFEHFT